MDKYEYNLKLEEIKKLIDKQDYKNAADIADTVEWKRVRNVRTLCMISEIYEANDRLEDAKEILLRAFARSSGSRTILYRLVEISVKMKEFDEAVEYYGDFINAAPNDNSRYILKYKIYKGRGSSVEDQIAILEEYKEREYTEKWAYELAKLYSKAGIAEKCIETCDDLVLWFHSGPYVVKALELKQKYAQLSTEQQAIYDRRFEAAIEKEEAVEAAVPQIEKVIAQKLPSSEEEALTQNIIMQTERELAHEVSHHAATTSAARNINDDWGFEAGNVSSGYEPEKPDAPGQARYDTVELQAELAKSMRELVSDIKKTPDHDPEKLRSLNIESLDEETAAAKVPTEEQNIEEIIAPKVEAAEGNLNGAKAAVERMKKAAPTTIKPLEKVEMPENLKAEAASAGTAAKVSRPVQDEYETNETSEADYMYEKPLSDPEDVSQAAESEEEEGPEFEEKQITGQLSIDDLLMSMGSEGDEAFDDDEEPEDQETGDDEAEDDGYGEDDEYEDEQYSEDDEYENEEYSDDGEYEDGRYSEDDEYEDEQYSDEEGYEDGGYGDAGEYEDNQYGDGDEYEDEQYGDDSEYEDSQYSEDEYEDEQYGEDGGYEDSQYGDDDTYEDSRAAGVYQDDAAEEPQAPAHSSVTQQTVDLSKDIDILKNASLHPPKENRADMMNTMDLTAAVQEAIRQVSSQDQEGDDAYQDDEYAADSDQAGYEDEDIQDDYTSYTAEEKSQEEEREEDHVWNTSGKTSREEAYKSVMPRQRGLTGAQRYLFSYFAAVQGMEPQILEALDEVIMKVRQDKTSRSGNLIITGMQGSGRTTLAMKFAKAVSHEKGEKAARIAKIYAEDLNKKDIPSTVAKIAGGFLIIEEAGDLEDETVRQLSKAMEFRTDGLVIIMEDERRYLKEMMADNPEFAEKFTAELTVPVFTNDELVTFGKMYANDLDYRIDEVAILALYNKIGDCQTAEQPVTILDVKEIVDDAIKRSERFGLRKLLMILTHKRYDEEDRIILFEKDFK